MNWCFLMLPCLCVLCAFSYGVHPQELVAGELSTLYIINGNDVSAQLRVDQLNISRTVLAKQTKSVEFVVPYQDAVSVTLEGESDVRVQIRIPIVGVKKFDYLVYGIMGIIILMVVVIVIVVRR